MQHDFVFANKLLYRTPEEEFMGKIKRPTLDFIKNKNLCTAKDTVKK